ncbi:MAG: hypothetical protein M0001_03630 [Treponema sp.]|nr:hypothetical protein [Treponema sp.]
MKLQKSRIDRIDKATAKIQYRDGLPPILEIEDGPDTEERIASYRRQLVADGWDPNLPPLVIISPRDDDDFLPSGNVVSQSAQVETDSPLF